MFQNIPHLSALRLRCPKCGHGKLFHGWFHMNSHCDSCGLKFEREAGFFLGSIYVNYGVTALVAVVSYLALAMVWKLPAQPVVLGCVAFTTLFPLWFFRYARSVFLTIDYHVSPWSYRDAADTDATRVERPVVAAHSHPEAGAAAVLAAVEQATSTRPIDEPAFSEEELTMLNAEDAHAGAIIGSVVLMAVLFGVTMGSFFVFTTMR